MTYSTFYCPDKPCIIKFLCKSFIAKTTAIVQCTVHFDVNKSSTGLIIVSSGFAGCSRGALSSTQSSLPDRLHRVHHWLPGQGHLWWSHDPHEASLDLQRWVGNSAIILGFPSKFVLAQNHRPQSVSHHCFIWGGLLEPYLCFLKLSLFISHWPCNKIKPF